ncbi:hypothetical protein APR12_004194 [Nocardia amikacinitolerans]|nr:hypothetical protein [Nocardia amikacinitolerans]
MNAAPHAISSVALALVACGLAIRADTSVMEILLEAEQNVRPFVQ